MKLLTKCQQVARLRHLSLHTERAYCGWIRRFLHWTKDRNDGNWQHPENLTATDITAFLTYLAAEKTVAESTQNQAFSALLFLYRDVLDRPGTFQNIQAIRAKKPVRLPVVFSEAEAQTVIAAIHDEPARLIARLMYGAGLRILEACRLRYHDIDPDRQVVTVRDGKGDKDRQTINLNRLMPDLLTQRRIVEGIHQQDLALGYGAVYLPNALARKYPNAAKELGWQWLFPSPRLSVDPRSDGMTRRHHVHPDGIRKAVKQAIRTVGITKSASCHTFRHSFATHLIERGFRVEEVQKLLGHKDKSTTQKYIHLARKSENPLAY